ncbi:MAG: alpha-amylase family glycosyl hydrolase [Chloroflexi bacterium]|nr:alpha-amylase family glycosyl hydrolase [Chloroflexota bacterium]
MHANPLLYEINTMPFLARLSVQNSKSLSLSNIPQEYWENLQEIGFDYLWLMGVWERSKVARNIALTDPQCCQVCAKALPNSGQNDIQGSPYAIYSYTLDSLLGNVDELKTLKTILNRIGLGLILDFVPNHIALDHPWTISHPEWFIEGTLTDIYKHPGMFFLTKNNIYLAHGKDPYFPPWSDTVQLNYYSRDLQQALISELLKIADVADGVRCDMAMLALNDIFKGIWGEFLKDKPPANEFWAEAIPRVKEKNRNFIFIAEVYWNLEPKLLQLGFDYTYDKILYDKLHFSHASDIYNYLVHHSFPDKSVGFIENHDEPRSITAFGKERSLAAAVVISTIPGLHLFYDGQLEGKQIKMPVQLSREPDEIYDEKVKMFYDKLLAVCKSPVFHKGTWAIDESSNKDILTWHWQLGDEIKIVAINYSTESVNSSIKIPFVKNHKITLSDELTGVKLNYEYSASHQIPLNFAPWQAFIFDVKQA